MEVYEVCRGNEEIPAAEVPSRVALDRCPLEEKVIVDNGLGTVLPDQGEGVYVHAMTVAGSQELEVTHSRDGIVELEHVGDESEEIETDKDASIAASGPSQCRDSAYTDRDLRVNWQLS